MCGRAFGAGPPCAVGVRLGKMAAHYVESHRGMMGSAIVNADIHSDGSKSVHSILAHSFFSLLNCPVTLFGW